MGFTCKELFSPFRKNVVDDDDHGCYKKCCYQKLLHSRSVFVVNTAELSKLRASALNRPTTAESEQLQTEFVLPESCH